MAFNANQLTKVANLMPVAGAAESRQLWWYEAGADSVAGVAAAGYFNDARSLLNVGDRIYVVGETGTVLGHIAVAAVPATGNVTSAVLDEGGLVMARGQHTTVDADDTIVTGLGALACVVATLDDDPVAGCQSVTATIGDQDGAPAAGSFQLKSWKATAADNSALIAATTFEKKVNWIAVAAD